MIKPSTKLKRGVEQLYNGAKVYVEIDKGNTVLVCDNELRRLEDVYTEVRKSELKPATKMRGTIESKPKKLTKAEKQVKAELNVYFASQSLIFPLHCEECGLYLNACNVFERRCMTAHILEKNDKAFPEVATHPQNKIFLGTKNCSCHTRYDGRGAEFRSQMKCYPLIIERYNTFKDKLSPKKLAKANEYLNIK